MLIALQIISFPNCAGEEGESSPRCSASALPGSGSGPSALLGSPHGRWHFLSWKKNPPKSCSRDAGSPGPSLGDWAVRPPLLCEHPRTGGVLGGAGEELGGAGEHPGTSGVSGGATGVPSPGCGAIPAAPNVSASLIIPIFCPGEGARAGSRTPGPRWFTSPRQDAIRHGCCSPENRR